MDFRVLTFRWLYNIQVDVSGRQLKHGSEYVRLNPNTSMYMVKCKQIISLLSQDLSAKQCK